MDYVEKTGTGRDHPEGGRNAPAFSWRSAGIWKWKQSFPGYEGSSDSAVVEYLNQNGMTYSQLVASNVMVLAAGVIYLAAGVVGVKQAGKVENAGLCVGMGGLLIAEVVAEVIVTLNFGDFDPASVIRMLMFPAIYMIGAVLNWQAKKTRR